MESLIHTIMDGGKMMKQRRVLGVLIILIGIVFLLGQLDLGIDTGYIFSTYWPIILILIGIVNLLNGTGFKLSGVILIVVGVLFQVQNLDLFVWDIDIWQLIFPSIIIIAGIWLVLPKNNFGKISTEHFVRQVLMFSGAKVTNESQEFKGADLFVAFGGMDLDLRNANVGADRPAKIDAFIAFGGADIIVPEDWKVRVTGLPLFGGWDNKTKNNTKTTYDVEVNLMIMFGGCDVKYHK